MRLFETFCQISWLIIQYCCLFTKIYWRTDIRFLALTCWSSVLITAAIVYLYATHLCKKTFWPIFLFFFQSFLISIYQRFLESWMYSILAGTFLPTCFLFTLCFHCRMEILQQQKLRGNGVFLTCEAPRPSTFQGADFFWYTCFQGTIYSKGQHFVI